MILAPRPPSLTFAFQQTLDFEWPDGQPQANVQQFA